MNSTKIIYSAVLGYIVIGALILFVALSVTGLLSKKSEEEEIPPSQTQQKQDPGFSINPGDLDFLEN